ncbi:MAG: LytR/AlgR family response regulator transcription factor [Sporichthyaceae bacterium]
MNELSPLAVLVVDDEAPALSELAYLLRQDPRIAAVHTADGATEALRVLESEQVDGVFLDIRMPGLSGLDLARVLARFASPPPIVFVTAFDDHAVDAFELNAVDYVLKPIRRERLAEAIRRMLALLETPGAPTSVSDAEEMISIELGGVTKFVARTDIRYVESHGDYARLHTKDGTHLMRVPMATLEERWADAGFLRIHRSYLVALAHVTEVHLATGRASVLLGNEELAVSRRHTRALREVLLHRARAEANAESAPHE